MSVQEVIEQARQLTQAQRVELMHALIDLLSEPTQEEKGYDLSDLEGIAAHLADGTDAQEYVNQLRSEWDHRP